MSFGQTSHAALSCFLRLPPMAYALTFFSEHSDEKDQKQFGKLFAALMSEMRKMPESAYADTKVQKAALEYLEHCGNSMRNDLSQKNIRNRMSNRLVKLRQIRKAKIMEGKLEQDADEKEAPKKEAGDAGKDKGGGEQEKPQPQPAEKSEAEAEAEAKAKTGAGAEQPEPAQPPSILSSVFEKKTA